MKDRLNKPIIFWGFPRSGTTIISEIILQHNKLAWISHYQQLFPYLPHVSLIRNIFQNSFWNIRGKKNQLNEVPFLNKFIFRPSESYGFWENLTDEDFGKSFLYKKQATDSQKKYVRKFLSKLVKFQNRSRLAFKLTGPSRLTYLNSIFPDAYFIRIKRNPLPTLRSLLGVDFWKQNKGYDEIWWTGKEIYTQDEINFINEVKGKYPGMLAAMQFYKINEIYFKERKRCEANIIEVSYEDFIEVPEKAVNKILDFVGLENDQYVKSYMEENRIYNQNKKIEYYISKEFDGRIKEIAKHGIV